MIQIHVIRPNGSDGFVCSDAENLVSDIYFAIGNEYKILKITDNDGRLLSA